MSCVVDGTMEDSLQHSTKCREDLDETLLLEILVRLTVVDIALLVLELLHGLLLEDLIPALTLELLGD